MIPGTRPSSGNAVELSWRLLVSAAQPYTTLSGPALSVHLLQQPSIMGFQRLPFHHIGVPGVYFHSLLHSLVEFACTQRPVRESHVRMMHAPMENFWDSVGCLNCTYFTAYGPPCRAHPVVGAVELASPTHRKKKDVRLSLYNDEYRALATMIMTGDGARETPAAVSDGSGGGSPSPVPHDGVGEDVLNSSALVGCSSMPPDGSFTHEALFSRTDDCADDVVPPWQFYH
ncbi:hypothetical protein ERJ75_000794200 [Trypanosoma vivax]|nr:hypothetical protein ERJ75_000794200 [Trypanosoma vivax]